MISDPTHNKLFMLHRIKDPTALVQSAFKSGLVSMKPANYGRNYKNNGRPVLNDGASPEVMAERAKNRAAKKARYAARKAVKA